MTTILNLITKPLFWMSKPYCWRKGHNWRILDMTYPQSLLCVNCSKMETL